MKTKNNKKPVIIPSDHAVFFDVDDTLVMWRSHDRYKTEVVVKDPYHHNKPQKLYVNDSHVKLLIRLKNKGKEIVVWSHGGYKWAAAVVEALGISEYVDYIMTKCEVIVDDKEWDDWEHMNIYLHKGYGK